MFVYCLQVQQCLPNSNIALLAVTLVPKRAFDVNSVPLIASFINKQISCKMRLLYANTTVFNMNEPFGFGRFATITQPLRGLALPIITFGS